MKKIFLLVIACLIFSLGFLITVSKDSMAAPACVKDGEFCRKLEDCRPSGQPSCASYVCSPNPNLRVPGRLCQPPSTPTPTLPPAPACSKARDTCERHKECQVSGEKGCKNYYCLSDPKQDLRTPRGICQFKPNFIPPGTPFEPDCKEDPADPKNYFCETAIGRIYTNPEKLVSQVLNIILGLAGGIALLLIIFSGYQMASSAGNPEKLQGAKETLTSAIVGLVFIILSISILRIIGVEILAIPGLKEIFGSLFK